VISSALAQYFNLTSVSNTFVTPEPMTSILFGSGLLALGTDSAAARSIPLCDCNRSPVVHDWSKVVKILRSFEADRLSSSRCLVKQPILALQSLDLNRADLKTMDAICSAGLTELEF
jgi:hypothetical protein